MLGSESATNFLIVNPCFVWMFSLAWSEFLELLLTTEKLIFLRGLRYFLIAKVSNLW